MRAQDIGTMSFSEPAEKQEIEERLLEVPALKDKNIETDVLEKVTRAYQKKYNIHCRICYIMDDSYLVGLEQIEPGGSVKHLTRIYAKTVYELFAKWVLFCYYYTRRKTREN